MLWIYDYRFSSWSEDTNNYVPIKNETKTFNNTEYLSQYVVSKHEFEMRLNQIGWTHEWFFVFRDVTGSVNERTMIASIIPKLAPVYSVRTVFTNTNIVQTLLILANFNCLVFDYVIRQKIGGNHISDNVSYQLPVLPPDRYSQNDINYITPRVLELTYTAWDIKPFADDLWNPTTPRSLSEVEGSKTETHSILTQASDKQQLGLDLDLDLTGKKQLELTTPPDPTDQTHLRQLILEQWQANRAAFPDTTQTPDDNLQGIPLPPFIWHETRRAQIRAELDAYYAKLYGLTRDELRYILDPADIYGTDFPSETFRVLKNNEMKKYGEYRTQRLVLEAWDALV
jgi:hypothetical protein